MKIKNSTRTRLIGYFGIAVTTLLTPGGKLISSALAAATVVGLVGMNIPSKGEKPTQSAPALTHTGSLDLNIDGDILGMRDLPIDANTTDTLSPETLGADQYSAQAYPLQENQNQLVLTRQGGSPGDIDHTFNVPNEGGSPYPQPRVPRDLTPIITAGIPPGDLLAGLPLEPEDLLPEINEGGSPYPQPRGPRVPRDPPPIITAGIPPGDLPPDLLGPEDLPREILDIPLASMGDPVASIGDPLVPTVNDEGTRGEDKQLLQPRLALAANAVEVTEPPTFGLLLLGLIGFGWLYRIKPLEQPNALRHL